MKFSVLVLITFSTVIAGAEEKPLLMLFSGPAPETFEPQLKKWSNYRVVSGSAEKFETEMQKQKPQVVVFGYQDIENDEEIQTQIQKKVLVLNQAEIRPRCFWILPDSEKELIQRRHQKFKKTMGSDCESVGSYDELVTRLTDPAMLEEKGTEGAYIN